MDRRKGKGKVSETSYYDDINKRKEADRQESSAALEREADQYLFMQKMKIFKGREERRGKDWVKTEDEMFNFNYYNDDFATEYYNGCKKLEKDVEDRKVSDTECQHLKAELHVRVMQKYEDLLDGEEAEIAKYVQEYEARQRQFPPEN